MIRVETPAGKCRCGCGQATRIAPCSDVTKGWIKGQPLRYILGHSRRLSPVDYIENPETDCWEWALNRDRRGYGRVGTSKGGTKLAHRVYYERYLGPIPEGLQIDHLCRNPCCVNPDHLEPVTNAENSRRGNMTRLNEFIVAAIRRSDKTNKELGAIYGVTPYYIWQIRTGRKWVAV